METISTAATSDLVKIYLDQAELYFQEKDWTSTIDACQKALEISPLIPEIYKLLGNVYQCRDEITNAMGAYAKALSLQPKYAEVYANLGSLYAKQKKWNEAVEYYEKAISIDPNFAGAYINLAKVQAKLEQPQKRLQSLIYALNLDPQLASAEEHYSLGNNLLENGKKEEAIQFYRNALSVKNDFVEPCGKLAEILEKEGNWKESVIYYRRLLELNQVNNLGAKQRYICATPKLNKNSQNEYLALLGNSEISGQTISDKPQLQLHVRDKPKSTSLKSNDSEAYLFQLLKLQEEQPISKDIQCRLGDFYVKQKKWRQAIKHYRNILRMNSDEIEIYCKIAKIYGKIGDRNLAADCWFQAFKLRPNLVTDNQYLSLGNALLNQKKIEKAIACYRKSIQINPDLFEARQKLAYIKENQNDCENLSFVTQELILTDNSQSTQSEIIVKDIDDVDLGPSECTSTIQINPKDNIEYDKFPEIQVRNNEITLDRSSLVDYQPEVQNKHDTYKLAEAMSAHKQGTLLESEERWDEAINAYILAIKLNAEFFWSHHSLGVCYQAISDWPSAVKAYRNAIEIDSEFVWSHYNLGDALLSSEHYTEAVDAYNQAQRLSDDLEQVANQLVKAYQQLISKQPRNLELYCALGEQQILAGKGDEAIATYQMALLIEPQSSEIALTLSQLIMKQDPVKAQVLRLQASSPTQLPGISTPADLYDLEKVRNLLADTELFDQEYYRQCCSHSLNFEIKDSLDHFLKYGVIQGYNPNPLFDTQYYLQKYSDVERLGVNPLAHYHLFGYRTGRRPHPYFSGENYLSLNPDVAAAQVDPLQHYLNTGAQQGRIAFSSSELLTLLEASTPESSPYIKCWNPTEFLETVPSSLCLGVYCSSEGNYFITEIANWFASALTSLGHQVQVLSEKDTPPENLDHHIVIAPHEFFYLGAEVESVRKSNLLTRAVMVNVEQPQTPWFSKAFHYLRKARIVFDINVKSSALLSSMGLPAYWLPLGYLDSYNPLLASRALPEIPTLSSLSDAERKSLPHLEDALSDRPLDIHFIGNLNPRREKFFNHNPWLNEYRCFFHLPTSGIPLRASDGEALDSEIAAGISRRSKILLNIHRDEFPYFSWHRLAFQGFWQNTLIVTEACHQIPGLVPGEHYIACSQTDMARTVRELLHTSDGQAKAERIRQAGYTTFRKKFDALKLIRKAVHILDKSTNTGV